MKSVLRWLGHAGAADLHVNLAWELVERLPAVWEALAAGDIDLARARVIISETSCLDEDAARNVADQILVGAGGRTTGQLRARLRRMVITVDPAAAQTRYENAVADRSVTLAANDDGTANMTAWNLPAARAQAAMRRVVATARAAKTADDPRTTDQARADTFLDLLDGTSNSASRGRRAGVDISVDLTTLLDLDEQPGEIGGYGPVIADVARQVLKDQIDAEWRVAVTDPDTGDIIWHGTTRRRPTAAQARDVRLRKRTCVFPGCRMPAADSDLDHTLDWARDGQTDRDNLAPLCRHDHRLKHKGGWSVTRLPDDT